jgi:chromate reductase
MRLLGIVGSLRKGSWNRALLRAITHNLPPHVTLDEYTKLAALPLFDPDDKSIPPPVADLKNAIDWASRPPSTSPLRGKPAAVVSASIGISGGMRAQYHLRQILVYTNTPVLAQPEVIIPRCHERFDGAGNLSDESTHELLKTFGLALADWVARLAPRAP